MRKLTWVETLTTEYNAGKTQLEKYNRSLKKADPYGLDPDIQRDIDTVSDMVSGMRFALEWMRSGRRPGNRRGIDRRSVYQRTALLDPSLFPSLDVEAPERRLTDEERRRIVDILWALSSRERQCYLLHMSFGMSYAEIGKELSISRYTARTFIERARDKVKENSFAG